MSKESKFFVLRKTVGFIAYIGGIWAMQYLYWNHRFSPYRYWFVLLPVVPMIYLIVTIIRYICGLDEMWRKIVLEALAFSALATIWTCISFFILNAIDALTIKAEWIFFLLIAYYLIGCVFSWRRYR